MPIRRHRVPTAGPNRWSTDRDEPVRKSRWLIAIVLAAIIALAGTGAASTATGLARDLVAAAGPVAPIMFVALYAASTVLLVPGAPMTALAGALFGPALGGGTVVLGATVGATAAFGLGRRLARGRVRGRLRGRLAQLDHWLARRGFVSILLLRLVPAVPFTTLNYAAGLSGVRLRHYVPATAIGIVPGTLAYATLGGTIHDPTSPAFLGAVMFLLLVVGAATALRAHLVRGRLKVTARRTPPARRGQER
jgi:uncharacterized membrane protein YdjX (TVP38/TMEM64 family)